MTITWAAYSVVSAYVASGLVGYVAARPRAKGVSVRKMKVHKGPLARSLGEETACACSPRRSSIRR